MIEEAVLTHTPKVTLNGTDITQIVSFLSVTESIFDPVLRGHVTTINTAPANLYQVSKAVGELNKIEFSFHSTLAGQQDKDIKVKDLLVYDMKPQAADSAANITFVTANFASKYEFINHSRLISKYYDDKISNIVSSLCKEIDIKCETEGTKDKIKRVLTYDSVFSHVINLSKQARSSDNPKDVDYVFYQDIEGKHHFKRLSSFKKKGVKWKYMMIDPNIKNMTPKQAKYCILRQSSDGLGPMKNAIEGMYSSEVISVDTTTGNYYSKTHVWKNGKYTTISDESLVQLEDVFKNVAQSGVAVRRYGKQRFLFDCEEEKSGQDKVGLEDDWVGDRLAAMQQVDQVVLYLNVPGNSEMKVGDIIEVRNGLDEDQIQDNGGDLPLKDILKTGKFMVTTISHDLVFKGHPAGDLVTTYIMRIKAVKDSKGGEYA